MIHLTSIQMILDEETMDFFLAGNNGEPTWPLDIDYRTAIDKEEISKEDMNLINYHGEIYEAQQEYKEAIQEAMKDYDKSVKIITNYYRSFGGIR